MADYALVVGIAKYPTLRPDEGPADLEGPDNDAKAVRDWLIDPEGGGLNPDNVTLLRSADFNPVSASNCQPAEHRIESELATLEKRTRDTPGDRLYLYFSGHGFAPALEQGALFTADATHARPAYVYAHAWLNWFRKAQRFRDFVLWMDSCMNWQQSIPVRDVLLRSSPGTGTPGPAFVGLAAQTKSALECRMAEDGQVHGVFTWTLLKGLKGAAADERGRITGESLKTFLHNGMPEFLPEETRQASTVDLQPFVRADDGIVFRRLRERPTYAVSLTVPTAAAGQRLRIWTGRPHTAIVSEPLNGTTWSARLPRGLYVVDVPDAGLRQGVQVSGLGDVSATIVEQGPPVIPSTGAELFRIVVSAQNAAASITVTDHRFERAFTETGTLDDVDAPGVYKIRVEFGRDITMVKERVVLLDRDYIDAQVNMPALASPAPLAGSAQAHAYQEAQFTSAADQQRAPSAGTGSLAVIARYWTGASATPATGLTFPHPLEGLRLLDANGAVLADARTASTLQADHGADPVATWERELAPGVYILQQALPRGRVYEGTIVVCAGRITQVAIRRATTDASVDPDLARVGAIGDVAVLMRSPGKPRAADQDAVIEAARLALAQGRDLLGEGRGSQLEDLLFRKYEDPIGAIVGADLLLLAAETDGRRDPQRATLFDAVVSNLRQLVGDAHPDVEALSLKCSDEALRATRPFPDAPMFQRSWRVMADASYQNPQLVPRELWERVRASTAIGSFFVWAADDASRAAHAEQLARWISGLAGMKPEEVVEAARRLGIPHSATVEFAAKA